MTVSIRGTVEKLTSVLLLLFVIALVSADTKTVVALSALCVVGYGVYRGLSSRDWIASRYTSLSRDQRVGIGAAVLVLLSVTAGVSGAPTDTVWVVAALVFTYVGYRGQGVIRGSAYGLGLGVTAGLLVIVLVLVVFGGAVLADVTGARRVLISQVLFAPAVVGFFGSIYAAFFLTLTSVFGLLCGSIGGALSRWV